jgi:c-di-AMP phosphodiesterase-like protein
MPKKLLERWHGQHIIWMFILLFALILALLYFSWIVGLVGLLGAGVLLYFTLRAERGFRRDLHDYVLTLSHRIKRSAHEVIHELPIGILLYNEEKVVEWHNPFVGALFHRESLVGEALPELFPMLNFRKERDKEDVAVIHIGEQELKVIIKPEERLLYFFNITDYAVLSRKYEEERLSLGIVMMDNLDEVTQGMDDQTRSILQARVIGHINAWALHYGIYMRRITADKFMLIMDQRTLREIVATKFAILDEVRDLTSEYKLPLTLSFGIASGMNNLIELGNAAQAALDIALGRGGDQAAVRIGQQLSFYGGRTNAVEKRTRVRARVISHALRDLILNSDKVIIMGHRYPDMDSLGAAIGILKAAQFVGKDGYVVVESENPGIVSLMNELRTQEHLARWIVTPDQALAIATPNSLAVVVDVHRASLVPEPRILQTADRIVVVDHHRRGEDFIGDATLIYMEPYASSTCELVTELLQYLDDRLTIDPFEATVLLAGMVVDTKSFSFRTGARTFEAASFLRRHGADTMKVQRLLQQDLETFNMKAEIIRRAEIYFGFVAIAVSEPKRKYSQLLIAQVADELLGMSGIHASFVIGERTDGGIGISARSLGRINVQVVMERLGGGGHLTNAAVKLDMPLDEAKGRLIALLEEYLREEGSLE